MILIKSCSGSLKAMWTNLCQNSTEWQLAKQMKKNNRFLLEFTVALLSEFQHWRDIVMVELIKKVNCRHLRLERWPAINLWFAGIVDCALLYLMCRAEIFWLSVITGHCLGFIIFCGIAVMSVRIEYWHKPHVEIWSLWILASDWLICEVRNNPW